MIEQHRDPPDEWLIKRLTATVEQLSERRKAQLMRDWRRSTTQRAKERREGLRVKIELGSAVFKAGLRSWSQDEVLGLLLDGRDRVSHSPTLRLAVRKKGEAFRTGRPAEATQSSSPPTIH